MNERVTTFELALRGGLLTQPAPEVGARLIPRLAEAARISLQAAETGRATAIARSRPHIARSRPALVARIAIAVAAIPALFAGLAVAGVKLPGPADSAFESVGIELPNQEADGDEQGTAAPAVKGTETGAESTDKGNSAAAHENAREQRKKARGKAVGHTRGKAIGLNELEPPGHSGDTGPPEHSSSGGAARSNSAGGKAGSTLPPRSRGRGKGPTK